MELTAGNVVAIMVALGSFVFTFYQWTVTMNRRRPNLKLLRFQLAEVFLNEDYKDFALAIKRNFILVNLSDLPNAVVSMKIHCMVGRLWLPGELCYEGSEEAFPIMIQSHSSTNAPKEHAFVYDFSQYPIQNDLDNLKVRVELLDQYGRRYSFTYTRKDFPELFINRVPRYGKDESFVGEVRNTDATGNPVIVKVVYRNKKQDPKDLEIGIREYSRSGAGWGGISIKYEYLKAKLEEEVEERFFYSDMGSSDEFSKKVYLHQTGKIPTQLEVELIYSGRKESKTFPLPLEFQELFRG